MHRGRSYNSTRHVFGSGVDTRLRISALAMTAAAGLVILRLVFLMVLQHDEYAALAAGSQDLYAQLFPNRGEIFMRGRNGQEYPAAINRDTFVVFVDTRAISDDETAEVVAEQLSQVLGYDDEKKFALYLNVNKRTVPYEPVEQYVSVEVVEQIKSQAGGGGGVGG